MKDLETQHTWHLRFRWHFKNALVIVLAIMLLAYFCVTQAYVLSSEYGTLSAEFIEAYAVSVLKSTLLVVTLGIMVSFFATQEYQAVFTKLIKSLSSDTTFEASDSTRDQDANPDVLSRSFIRKIDSHQERFKELAYLEHSVDTMINRNKVYRSQLERQRELLKETFLIQLVSGWFQDASEASSIGASLDIPIENGSAQVTVFSIDWSATENTPESHKVKEGSALLRGLLDQMVAEQFISHAVEIDGYVACLILSTGDDSLSNRDISTELFRIVSLVRQIVSDKTELMIRAAIGKVGHGIDDIAESYAEAIGLLDYAKMIGDQGNVSQHFDGAVRSSSEGEGSAWIKREVHFLNCVRAEDYYEASAIFDELISSDYARSAPSLELAKHRKLVLVNMLINAQEEMVHAFGDGYGDQLCSKEEIIACVSLQELGRCAARMFQQAGYIAGAKKSGSSYERMANVTEYILECFRDPDLNVNSIALQFNLNPSYLSRTFKNMMSVGLFDFIQQLRIKEAKTLMRNTDRSIKNIAEYVGFSNTLAMNRAFKKHEGTTPSGLRTTIDDE